MNKAINLYYLNYIKFIDELKKEKNKFRIREERKIDQSNSSQFKPN